LPASLRVTTGTVREAEAEAEAGRGAATGAGDGYRADATLRRTALTSSVPATLYGVRPSEAALFTSSFGLRETRHLTTSVRPLNAARCRGAQPSVVVLVGLLILMVGSESRYLTTSVRPFPHAAWSGVMPSLSALFRVAPGTDVRILTISKCPLKAARCNAVFPSFVV
jgi:hypothetical protein